MREYRIWAYCSDRLCLDDEDEDEIESEDPDSDQGASTRSASVAGGSGKMTARQAVLANVVGASHVSLGTQCLVSQLPTY